MAAETTAKPTVRPAVQVVYPGRLVGDMRMVEGVRRAAEAAAQQLEVPVGTLRLVAVEITEDPDTVAYTFTERV